MKLSTLSFLRLQTAKRSHKKSLCALSIITSLMIASSISTPAYSFNEHEAHVHGHASLNIAAEGEELQIIFKSPAMNIVGFEHSAKSKQDKKKVKDAVAKLESANTLFAINSAAGCELEKAHVSSELIENLDEHHKVHHHGHHNDHHKKHHKGHHHGHHEDHHDNHSKEHEKKDHKNKQHKKHHGHHEDHHDKHGKGHHDVHEEVHSEFEAEYHFECKNIKELTKLDVGLFMAFPSLQEVEAQVITKGQQALVELSIGKTVVEFK